MTKTDTPTNPENVVCPKCGSPLSPVEETPNGKQLQRCSTGSWNPEEKKVEGCEYVKWIQPEPEVLDEKCPKCGEPLVMATTRFGKKLKKCSTSGWDRENKKATGCDYIQWLTGIKEELDEKCPDCGEKLVMMTTNRGKKLKKCSTSGWDREKKEATGCTYVEWINDKTAAKTNGDEKFPDHEI
ncbi:MAG: topoisomerase DNA-binding C4 zinc finger domain-containing protein [Candidatus Roizmanbacteria bacterium]|nr:topoisomerase DNA-binding C4 zinc finger domain-containing protein [Candidatus Roizmanbacteria bacterium]